MSAGHRRRLDRLERSIKSPGRFYIMWDDQELVADYDSPALEARVAAFKAEHGVGERDLLAVISWLGAHNGDGHGE